jgi:phosphoribosyl-dephospho-CoA transferase
MSIFSQEKHRSYRALERWRPKLWSHETYLPYRRVLCCMPHAAICIRGSPQQVIKLEVKTLSLDE